MAVRVLDEREEAGDVLRQHQVQRRLRAVADGELERHHHGRPRVGRRRRQPLPKHLRNNTSCYISEALYILRGYISEAIYTMRIYIRGAINTTRIYIKGTIHTLSESPLQKIDVGYVAAGVAGCLGFQGVSDFRVLGVLGLWGVSVRVWAGRAGRAGAHGQQCLRHAQCELPQAVGDDCAHALLVALAVGQQQG
eukprot:390642-Prorocentrum_minimum.AAC.1